jgi:hypothetical protein
MTDHRTDSAISTPIGEQGASITHDGLASMLAKRLNSGSFCHRVTWENLEFSNWSEPETGFRCRPDVFSIFPTLDVTKCRPWAHEIKISRADFLRDVRSGKWKSYTRFSSRVFFAAPIGLIQPSEVPDGAGLWEFDASKPDLSLQWEMRKPAKYCKGWTLPPRHLMKLILGRWGTYQGQLPAPTSEARTNGTGLTY